MDVSEFWDLEFVKERQKNFGAIKVVDNKLEQLNSQNEVKDKYDVILFTEILEHITFNPINFWKKIYSLIQTRGYIYISTPNSMSLLNIIRSLARILLLRGIGEPVNEIFKKVTYGHHWKEYSPSELKRYFSKMSEDFTLQIKKYGYIDHEVSSFQTAVSSFLAYLGNTSNLFAEDLEAIVHVEKTGNWKIEPPEY
jgi:2-polyprenyl-6-hydroxyphenyl methylase/3-demethylubiquinone-9 3-methyltransferase